MLSIRCNSRVKYEEINKDSQIITKVKPFINKQEETNFPSEKDDWKKFEKNNVIIDLNILYAKNEKIYPTYISNHSSNREKRDILLMITNENDGIILDSKN